MDDNDNESRRYDFSIDIEVRKVIAELGAKGNGLNIIYSAFIIATLTLGMRLYDSVLDSENTTNSWLIVISLIASLLAIFFEMLNIKFTLDRKREDIYFLRNLVYPTDPEVNYDDIYEQQLKKFNPWILWTNILTYFLLIVAWSSILLFILLR